MSVRTCDICGAVIKPGLLMCSDHWRRVPRRLQADVWETYRAMQAVDGKRPEQRIADVRAYRSARDAAIAAVRSKR